MPHESDLVLLEDCSDQMQLAMLKSLLDAQGISYIAQGEHHATMINGHFSMIAVTPRLLVAGRDLERARAVLDALPVLAPEDGAQPHSDAVCPVHEQEARATCDRCGTYLCDRCASLGTPPLCEECLEVESKGLKPALTPGQKRLRGEAAFAIPVIVLVVLAFLVQLVGC